MQKKLIDLDHKTYTGLEPNHILFLRNLADRKWQELSKKVETMADEVFANVMESEIALCKLENTNFTEHIPPEIKEKS